jgi:predicted TIM-barrel fold metal-dependent hydrolase/GNAT superfamily N-acetyltransferase
LKIIDSHIHVGLQSFFLPQEFSPPFELCNNYEDTIALMDKHEVEQAVIAPISHHAFDVKRSNEYIYEASCRFPSRLIPFCRIDDDLEKNISRGFQGVKLHLLYEDIEIKTLKKELQLIEDAGVPLLLHALFRDKVKQVEQILKFAPNLKVILAHMGRGNLYTGEQVVQNAIGLRRYPNVFMDTSTVGDIQAIINACEVLGYNRVLYGSDYPFGRNVFGEIYNYERDPEQLLNALSPQQAEMVLHDNLLSLYSPDTVQVRRVKRGDYDLVFSLLEQTSEIDKKFLALSSKYTLIRQVVRSERHCYVALWRGELLGFLRESGRPEGYSLLEEIVVSPKHRNRGIASALLQRYHSYFPKTMAKANAKNEAIIRLLKKSGYTAENPDAPRIINWIRNGHTL